MFDITKDKEARIIYAFAQVYSAIGILVQSEEPKYLLEAVEEYKRARSHQAIDIPLYDVLVRYGLRPFPDLGIDIHGLGHVSDPQNYPSFRLTRVFAYFQYVLGRFAFSEGNQYIAPVREALEVYIHERTYTANDTRLHDAYIDNILWTYPDLDCLPRIGRIQD